MELKQPPYVSLKYCGPLGTIDFHYEDSNELVAVMSYVGDGWEVSYPASEETPEDVQKFVVRQAAEYAILAHAIEKRHKFFAKQDAAA